MLEMTEDTFDLVKSVVTSGWLAGLGVQGVDLGALVSLVPVETPFRNSLARINPKTGSKFTYWRSLLNVNSAQPNPAVGDDYAGGLVEFSDQDVYAPYVPLRLTGRVTQDAIDVAEGYENALAVATMQVVNQLMIGEDKHAMNGLAYPLGTAPTPAVTTSTTGGSIAASTAVDVKIAARSGINYYYGGSGVASAQGAVTTGSSTATNTATATWTSVPGAPAYDVFVAGFYYTTVTVNSCTITFIPTANQALPNLPDISTIAPVAVPTADTSYNSSLYYNGLIASITGDYGSLNGVGTSSLTTHGSGLNNGSYWATNNGGTLTLSGGSISQLDALNLAIWNYAKISPTRYLMNAAESTEMAGTILSSTSAVTYLQPDDVASRQNVVVGGRVGTYLNRSVNGQAIVIETLPHIPPGIILAVCDRITYPGANIDAPMSLRIQRDFAQFPYGANYNPGVLGGGPRSDFDVTVRETFKLAAPLTCGVLQDVS